LSLFPNEDILTKQIESWTSFVYSLSSYEDRKLFENILNDCYKYAAAINVKGEPLPAAPLLMALLLLSIHKMIDWSTKQISKYESFVNNNNTKEVNKAKQLEEQDLGIENTNLVTFVV
jgi:hypothetical protein